MVRVPSLVPYLVSAALGCGLVVSACGYLHETAAAGAPAETARAVATFDSLGLYWTPDVEAAIADCPVRYRRQGDRAWRDGHPLWYDERVGECRGSLVHLAPDTVYEIELSVAGSHQTAALTAKTWSESFPIARTIRLPERSEETLTIEESGSPDGYLLYTAAPGKSATIDAMGAADSNVVVKGSYVILRDLHLVNAARNAIELGEGAHDVVIEGNDISGWGRIDVDGWGMNLDAAVYSDGKANPPPERIVIQHNRMHHPRSDSNAWDEYRAHEESYHPRGPQAIYLNNSRGNHVIRYNDIYSDDDHMFNDCIGGGANFSDEGFPNRDSDIYGNRISDCWDDGIEAEGANANVRIWGNYIDRSFVMIAVAATDIGPLYIWRNLSDRSRRDAKSDMEDAKRGYFLKTQSKENSYNGEYFGDGRIYVYHNTLLQRPEERFGVSSGITDYGGRMTGVVSRNNILHVNRKYRASVKNSERHPSNHFDYDLFNGKIIGTDEDERNGISGEPKYRGGEGAGSLALAPDSPGRDAGLRIPNFNDDFSGDGPDMGAFESGAPDLRFGVEGKTVEQLF